jgi:hypothetical protein
MMSLIIAEIFDDKTPAKKHECGKVKDNKKYGKTNKKRKCKKVKVIKKNVNLGK